MNLRKLHEFALVNATRALVLISLLVLAAPAPADSRNLQEPKSSAVTVQERQDVAGNLASILQSIETKRSAIGELRKQLRNSEEPSERLEIEQKIDQHRRDTGIAAFLRGGGARRYQPVDPDG